MPTLHSRPIVAAACAALALAACKQETSEPGEPAAKAQPSTTPDKVAPAPAAGRIPVTTASAEARALYDKAYGLQLVLRAADAHAGFAQAVAKDPDFALAHLGLAATSPTNQEFLASLERAVALAAKVSEPERLWIAGVDAGARNDPEAQLAAFTKLVEVAPHDPQALNLLGNVRFNRQEYDAAIVLYTKAIALDPTFTQPYNQLGYVYRFVGKYDEAQRTFEKYIQLIPNDPNPHDSYAELLMKRGKFDESIASYEKALAIDPSFVASHVGIGNNHIFAGRGDQAREAFAKLGTVARNVAEKRQALLWTAVSYTHEGNWEAALGALDQLAAAGVESKDPALIAADHNLRGTFLLEAGKPDAAAKAYELAAETIAKATVPDAAKEQAARTALYNRARVALAKKDRATARATLDAYRTAVAPRQLPFEVRQVHELAGMIALDEKRPADAVTELAHANQQDPRILFLLATAHAAAGNADKAKALYTEVRDWNALAVNHGFVKAKAAKALGGT
jgi:tetratricopeptide (TPR) repeat protein